MKISNRTIVFLTPEQDKDKIFYIESKKWKIRLVLKREDGFFSSKEINFKYIDHADGSCVICNYGIDGDDPEISQSDKAAPGAVKRKMPSSAVTTGQRRASPGNAGRWGDMMVCPLPGMYPTSPGQQSQPDPVEGGPSMADVVMDTLNPPDDITFSASNFSAQSGVAPSSPYQSQDYNSRQSWTSSPPSQPQVHVYTIQEPQYRSQPGAR